MKESTQQPMGPQEISERMRAAINGEANGVKVIRMGDLAKAAEREKRNRECVVAMGDLLEKSFEPALSLLPRSMKAEIQEKYDAVMSMVAAIKEDGDAQA